MSKGTSNDQRAQIAAEWLVRLASGAPGEAELAAWRKWLEQDPDNGRVFEELQQLWSNAKKMPPSAETLAAILETDEPGAGKSLELHAERWWPRLLHERRPAARLAAALVASAALAMVVRVATIDWRADRIQAEILTTQVGQNNSVVLQDGSTVDLGGRSAVEVNYTGHQRLLKMLAGEAYFQDRDYANWPFVVSAGGLQVKAIGTAFDVKRDRDQISVSVTRGEVELSLTGHGAGTTVADTENTPPGSGPKLLLRSGEKAVVYSDGSMREYAIDPDEITAWRKGSLQFTNASLTEVIESVDRYTDRPIVIAGPAVGSMRFTGTVLVGATGEWVGSLPAVFPLTVDISDPKLVVLRPVKSK